MTVRFRRLIPLLFLFGIGILFLSIRSWQKHRQTSCSCGQPDKASGEYEINPQAAIFNNQPVNYMMAQLPEPLNLPILGATNENKWIEIDLSEQKLYAHNGDQVDYAFLVSSGKWAPTPTGDFRIWSKFKYTKMEGGNKALHTYYYLPNVPYTQYFYKDFGLHGTYWHNNFGHPMSHGCVNLATPDAEKLFYWTTPLLPSGQSSVRALADQGTRVVIHE